MTTSERTAREKSPAIKVREDPRTISKGSRLIPILMLIVAVVCFVAFAIQLPDQQLELYSVTSESEIPSEGKDLFIIARVDDGTLHFRAFNNAGEEKAGHSTDVSILARTDAAHRDAVNASLADLKARLASDWPAGTQNPELPADEREYIIGQTFELLSDSGVLKAEELFWFFVTISFQSAVHELATSAPAILWAQLKTLRSLAFYSLIPGLFGLIYRRSFGKWFIAAFVILFLVNQAFGVIGFEMIASARATAPWTETFVQFAEEAVLLALIAFRLRRHTVGEVARSQRVRAASVAAGMLLVAGAGVVYWWSGSVQRWHVLEAAIALIVISVKVLTHVKGQPDSRHGKNIVVCLDGTWNQPGERDFNQVAVTNVFKVFNACKGQASAAPHNASQSKVYLDAGDAKDVKQVAFYYRGVGNRVDNSALGQMFGGAFGLGADAIVERAYLDVVTAYRPGDRIFIVGFSRGAAIARLLANVIGRRGVPNSLWTLRLFGQHWLLRKSSVALDVHVDVLGCWDTVGSFGLAKNILGIPFQSANLLKDLGVSLSVKRAYHMVALDETRDAFVPTLMEPDPTAPDRIVEVWFSGNHSNVGGGYATDNLSDVALDFLLSHISSGYAREPGQVPGNESWGVYLSAVRKGLQVPSSTDAPLQIDPNPHGSLRHATGPVYSHAPRKLPSHAVIHDHVFERLNKSLPVYAPQSLFDLNQHLVKMRHGLSESVTSLVDTRSLDQKVSEEILNWSTTHLSLTKWSTLEALNPAEELENSSSP